MSIHLIKLAVGVPTVEFFQTRVAERRDSGDGMHIRTRSAPKRAAEVVETGSLYWVVAGLIAVRQRVLAIEADTYDDGSACARIELEPELIRVAGQRVRPFQGWRYLEPAKAPPDQHLSAATGLDRLPPDVFRQLRELCLV